MWYRIELSYAVFAIRTKKHVVVEAAPIGRWMIGKNIGMIKSWVLHKRGYIDRMSGR